VITADALVEHRSRRWGRLAGRPDLVNPLDAFTGPRRRWESFRLKEWIGFTLIHPDWASSMIIQDAKYLATSEIYGFHRATGDLYERSAAGRGRAQLPARLFDAGRCVFDTDGHRLEYAFDRDHDHHRILINISGSPARPAFSGELHLDAGRSSAALAVSSPLRRRQRPSAAAMFTYKVIFPACGELMIAGHRVVFDPARDVAILDEHRSHLPYRTDWTWGTFALQTPAGIVGANCTTRSQPPGTEEESCIWTPQGCEAVAGMSFTPLSPGRLAPTRVSADDGRLDLIFTPQGRKDATPQLVVASMNYFQQCGTYRGTVRGLDGTVYQIDDVPGVLERMHARL
jgi:hypothetical protein